MISSIKIRNYVSAILDFFSLLGAENAQATSPNILLINIDDLGWRDLGYMGSYYYETVKNRRPGINDLHTNLQMIPGCFAFNILL